MAKYIYNKMKQIIKKILREELDFSFADDIEPRHQIEIGDKILWPNTDDEIYTVTQIDWGMDRIKLNWPPRQSYVDRLSDIINDLNSGAATIIN